MTAEPLPATSQPEPRPHERSIPVLLIASIRLYREELARALARDPRVEVVGVAESAAAGLSAMRRRRPSVVLLDVDGDGPGAARMLSAAAPDARLVALAVEEREVDIIAWAEAGISGYVTTDDSLEDLFVKVTSAAHGDLPCSPRIAGVLLRRVRSLASSPAPAAGAHPRLTSREREVLDLITEGLANKQIASRLQIEVPTVKNHVHNILDKLGVSRRAEAVAIAGRQPRS